MANMDTSNTFGVYLVLFVMCVQVYTKCSSIKRGKEAAGAIFHNGRHVLLLIG